MKPSITEPYDGIPSIVFRKCAKSLSKPLAHIFNISLMLGEVLEVWKDSIVVAIPKTTKPRLVSEFRPISLTPTPVKVMEKFIQRKVLSWISKFHPIAPQQHGFLPGVSTTTNILDSIFDWNLALNHGCCTDLIFNDLSKAFDRVNHVKLIHRLYQVGIDGNLLKWFRSYLHERYMTVKIGGKFSDRHHCCGVPQGGALSHLLFLIYTMDFAFSHS